MMDRKQWNDLGQNLKDDLEGYNWNYRVKICSNCPLSVQEKRKCLRCDNFKIIGGKKIQETHCKWLVRARTKKFSNRIDKFLGLGFYAQS